MFTGTARTIALDRLQASLTASGTVNPAGVPVQNDPPRVIVSYSPAILVPISGSPIWRGVPDSRFERVINTRALILRKKGDSTCYLHVYDGWLSAASVEGSWSQAMNLPWGIEDVANRLVEQKLADPLSGGNAQPPPSLANGVPTIYVSQVPAELIVFNGQPNLQPVSQTALLWASNTTADVIVDTGTNFFYVLLSGRWYRAASLNGPWRFVAGSNLPPDFSRIPVRSPAGVVLASVAGTPQAREAVIVNSVPQTGTIPRTGGPTFAPVFDGAPRLNPIAGTPLQYVVNSPVPIVRVDAYTWYALQAGVWFTATALNGPWGVAASVPAVIYTIPPSSPLYYVTFVRVYGSTPEAVYVGYTPGYLGTVVEPDGTVVYGTGYVYEPWVGTAYYPPPATYGVAAQPVYNPAADMAYGMALGMTTAAMVDSWGQPAYYDSYYHGYPCCGSTSANVYGHYGSTSWSGSDTWYSHSDGNVGQSASGSYTNYRTGTTGSYSGNRYVNPYDGDAGRGYTRTYDTAEGPQAASAAARATTPRPVRRATAPARRRPGRAAAAVTRDTNASWGAQGTGRPTDRPRSPTPDRPDQELRSGYSDRRPLRLGQRRELPQRRVRVAEADLSGWQSAAARTPPGPTASSRPAARRRAASAASARAGAGPTSPAATVAGPAASEGVAAASAAVTGAAGAAASEEGVRRQLRRGRRISSLMPQPLHSLPVDSTSPCSSGCTRHVNDNAKEVIHETQVHVG